MMTVTEYMDESGANALARRIRNFWSERGFDVEAWAEEIPIKRHGQYRDRIWCVRSDMVNGLPQRKAIKAAA